MILSLVDHNDPILHAPCEKFNFSNPQVDILEFSHNLSETMFKHGAMGIAANQVGVNLTIFAMAADPAMVVINPKIIDISDELALLEEGCLSYPGIIIKVKRPSYIKARFNYPDGNAKTHEFHGMTARCFLHEYAHLQGRTMIDDTNKFYRDKAKKTLSYRTKALDSIKKVIR